MSENYTGYSTIQITDSKINELYKKGHIDFPDNRFTWYPASYIELISNENDKHTALGKIKNNRIELVKPEKLGKIKSRNREQVFAIDALLDPDIDLVVLTGHFGGGKTILSLGAGLQAIEDQKYKKLILSKPMTQIGKHQLGILPGEASDKLRPFLVNYESNLTQIVGDDVSIDDIVEQYHIEFRPIQLFLGASFANTFLIIDEAANLEVKDIGALLSRAGENCKVVIMGDHKQIHDKIEKKNEGLRKLVNDKRIKESPFCAVIELQKCERSRLATLIGDIFGE